jgi:isopentenyldiphosphate isomerase
MTELFETFDDAGNPIGLVERATVHAQGIWHKSSHIFLFRSDGRLIVQRRAAGKDLYANRLDYSVGEHLQPGETHEQAAHRGLQEELDVRGVTLEPLGGIRRARYEDEALGVKDHEIQQAFRGTYDGPITPDPIEVADVASLPLEDIAKLIDEDPGRFTPWFAQELLTLGILR